MMSFERTPGVGTEPAPVPPSGTATADAVSPAMRLQILSTEHWSLLASRSLAWNESFSRAGMFLSTLTGAIVALALAAQASAFGEGFTLFALVILPVVLFIGVATSIRLGASNYHDALCILGMNRIRAAYLQLAPDVERYFVMSAHDDLRGLAITAAVPGGGLMSVAHLISATPAVVVILNAVLAGIIAAVAALRAGAAAPSLIVIGAVFFVAALVAQGVYAGKSVAKVRAGLQPNVPNASRHALAARGGPRRSRSRAYLSRVRVPSSAQEAPCDPSRCIATGGFESARRSPAGREASVSTSTNASCILPGHGGTRSSGSSVARLIERSIPGHGRLSPLVMRMTPERRRRARHGRAIIHGCRARRRLAALARTGRMGMAKLTRKQLLKTGAIGAAALAATLATQTRVLAGDDKLDRDAEVGATDIAAQVRRFNRVSDIVQRAIARYQQISDDLGPAGPSPDPTVQAALQAIDGNAQSLINRVLQNPGPTQDPAVRQTLGMIVGAGTQLANDASAALGLPAPCTVGTTPP